MHLTWQPSASIEHLRARAGIIKTIRDFFSARDVLEVETPLMCHTSVTDPVIQSIPALFQAHPDSAEQRYYLQTSPEYAMKRLLAAGSGSIYQICKAFRQGEIGRLHNPEFTMLEWYRVSFDHHQLMDEVEALLLLVLGAGEQDAKQRDDNWMPAYAGMTPLHAGMTPLHAGMTPLHAGMTSERITYQKLFQSHLSIDPLDTSVKELITCAKQHDIHVAADIHDIDTWLDILMTHCIEPALGKTKPVFVYDFPASQAALARLSEHDPRVATRFEVYANGMELANGFYELQDADEQRRRFEANLSARKRQGLTILPIDDYFISALRHGLPDCAGVALGIDRLVMIALNRLQIPDVISFDFSRS